MNPPDCQDGCGDDPQTRLIADLHAECSPQLTRLAWAILRDWELAADAVQETFKLLSQKISGLDGQHLRGWLTKTVQFQSLNLRRSQQRAVKLVQRIREEPTAYVNTASEAVEQTEKMEALQGAIRTLPDEQREIVQRRLVLQQGFAEIADELQIPLGTVLSRMRLAVEKLRKTLADEA